MKRVFIVSRFLKEKEQASVFHFVGYFQGKKIKKIIVRGGKFIKDEDYVLALTNISYKEDTLYGDLIKCKKLF